jgi:hypothetical protein
MSSTGQAKQIERNVVLSGIRPIMFDRYAGDNKTQLNPTDKMYLDEKCFLVLPVENLFSFLTATNTTSAPKRLTDKREYKDVCSAFLCFVDIQPEENIPFLRNGKPIHVGTFDGDIDKESGIRIDHRVARLEKGVPNPKARPMLPLPWELNFRISLYKNNEANEALLKKMFDEGGIVVGLGTFRGRYGKFEVSKWE